jgi:hypothetical protein
MWRATLKRINESLGTKVTQHVNFRESSVISCQVQGLHISWGAAHDEREEALAWWDMLSFSLVKFSFVLFYMSRPSLPLFFFKVWRSIVSSSTIDCCILGPVCFG